MWWNICLVSCESWELILQFVSSRLTKLDETISYCWCPIIMRWSLWLHHCDVINKAASQWLLTFNLCISVTWPLTCAFHIPCTHTPEIIDMHRGVCDNVQIWAYLWLILLWQSWIWVTVGSGNGLSPICHRAFTWINDDILLTGSLQSSVKFLSKGNNFIH